MMSSSVSLATTASSLNSAPALEPCVYRRAVLRYAAVMPRKPRTSPMLSASRQTGRALRVSQQRVLTSASLWDAAGRHIGDETGMRVADFRSGTDLPDCQIRCPDRRCLRRDEHTMTARVAMNVLAASQSR